MPETKHLLFIPCERLGGLVSEDDITTGMPPIAGCVPGGKWSPFRIGIEFARQCGQDVALILIWEGTPQPMGIWPLVASMPDRDPVDHLGGSPVYSYELMLKSYHIKDPKYIADLCERLGMGRTVIVEADHA